MNGQNGRWLFLGGFFLPFLAFLFTLPTDLTIAHFGVDGGELIAASRTWGVAHPPGYPTYIVLSNLFSQLPIGNIALRYNLFSACCMAVAAGFVTLIVWERQQRSAGKTALVCGWTFGLTGLVWQQAIIAEVYGLFLALLSGALWALVSKRPFWLIGLLFGFAITGHPTALIFLPIFLFDLKNGSAWRSFLGGILVGLTPFGLLPWLARSGSPVIWGDPTTLSGWWWLVSSELYRPLLFGLPAAAWGPRLASWAGALLAQQTLLWLPLVVWALWQTNQQEAKRPLGHDLLWLGCGGAVLLMALGYNTGDAIVFTLPMWMVTAVLMDKSLEYVGNVALFLPLTLLLLNFNELKVHSDKYERESIVQLLDEVPKNAVLETSGDPTTFSLWYFRYAEQQRPDILHVDNTLWPFSWYRANLQALHPTNEFPEEADWQQARAWLGQQGPLCLVKRDSSGKIWPECAQ